MSAPNTTPGDRRPGATAVEGRSPLPPGPRWSYGRQGYALAQSLRQLRARKLAGVATLLVLGVTLALPALLLFVADALAGLGHRALEGESLTLYLDPATTDLDGAALAGTLAARPDVRDTRYVSRDEALAVFRARSDVAEALDALGENPLPGAVILYPTPAMLGGGRVKDLAAELGELPAVERVQVDLLWVQRLRTALALVRLVGLLLGGFLLLTSLLVIGNTLRLELARRRPELEVSRLLGASAAFLYRPVLLTGVLYGALGGVAACVLALAALQLLRGPVDELARLYGSTFRLPLPALADLALVTLVSTLLGLGGALLTLYDRSRLKVPPGA